MVETILIIIVGYILGVTLYTVWVRNDSIHKYAPDVKIMSIIKEGAIGIGIGFAVVAALYYAWGLISYFLV